MFPDPLFYLWGQGINLYFLIAVGASLPCLFLAIRLGLKVPPKRPLFVVVRTVVDGFVLVVLTGVIGCWLFSGCMASLGGIITAVIAVWIYVHLCAVTKEQPGEALDVLFPPLVLYQGLFRLGCFSSGCCHGKPAYGLPWAVAFTHPHTACIFRGIPVHPTQLYMVAGNLAIFFLLFFLFGRPLYRGRLVGLYLLSYGLLRFLVEFYRGDARPMVGSLSLNQWVCLLFIGVGAIILAQRLRRQKRTVAV